MDKHELMQNINNALNDFLWALFKDRHINDDTLISPLCAYILIHLYINRYWSFASRLKIRCCNNLRELGLVGKTDQDVDAYRITDLGRQCVEHLIPHYQKVFWILYSGIIAQKLFGLAIIGLMVLFTDHYPSLSSLIPSHPAISASVSIALSIVLGIIGGVILCWVVTSANPLNCTIGLHQASLGRFIKLINYRAYDPKYYRQDALIIRNLMFPVSHRAPSLISQPKHRIEALIHGI